MIGPKEWSELKASLTKLNPFLRIKKLKEILVQTSDASLKKEIKELILKAEAESVDLFSRSSESQKLPAPSLEHLVDKKPMEPKKKKRSIEEIASEDSTLTDSEIKKADVNYSPEKENKFYESGNLYESSESQEYSPFETDFSVEIEENDLNKSKDYVNREEVEF